MRANVFITRHLGYLCDDALWCALVFIAHDIEKMLFVNVIGLQWKSEKQTILTSL